MSGINNEYNVYLKVLTPLHIGGQQEKNLSQYLDYIVHNGKTWRLNWKKLYEVFNPDDIANAIINNNLKQLIVNEIEDVADEMEEVYSDTGEVKTFIRNGLGKAYIPGSSIKGAMKNWLYVSLEKELKLRNTYDLLGQFDNDLFRFIEPSDCEMKNEVELFSTKTFNLRGQGKNWEGGWKHSRNGNTTEEFKSKGFVTDYECYGPDSMGKFSLKIRKELNENIFERLYSQNNNARKSYSKVFGTKTLENLFSFINRQTKQHIEKELNFFKTFNQAEDSEDIIHTLESLLEISNKVRPNECLLRLSAGSGFHGITGDFQFEDHTKTGIWNMDDAKKYKLSKRQTQDYVGSYMKFKSRKIAFTSSEMFPMGFVLLSTEPFSNEKTKSEKVEVQSIDEPISKPTVTQPKIQAEYKDAKSVKNDDVVFGEVKSLGKPFGSVQLFLNNYPFDGIAQLSGIKNTNIQVGQIVKCQLGNASAEGEFKQVKYIP